MLREEWHTLCMLEITHIIFTKISLMINQLQAAILNFCCKERAFQISHSQLLNTMLRSIKLCWVPFPCCNEDSLESEKEVGGRSVLKPSKTSFSLCGNKASLEGRTNMPIGQKPQALNLSWLCHKISCSLSDVLSCCIWNVKGKRPQLSVAVRDVQRFLPTKQCFLQLLKDVEILYIFWMVVGIKENEHPSSSPFSVEKMMHPPLASY
jgi:hypothetical protein